MLDPHPHRAQSEADNWHASGRHGDAHNSGDKPPDANDADRAADARSGDRPQASGAA